MQKIRINDEVIILAGKDKGKKGKVSRLFFNQNRILVEGVNMVKKCVRPNKENPNGSIMDKEATLHISNVSLYSEKAQKASRVGIKEENGKKVRYLKACGTILS